MALQALLFADDPASWQHWLRQCVGDELVLMPADATRPEACANEIDNTPDIGLVFVAFSGSDHSKPQAIIENITEAYDALPVVALSQDDKNPDVLAAMRAGARDFFVAGRDDERLRILLDRVLEGGRTNRHVGASARPRGQVVTLLSGPQSPLIAFAAGHVAFVLASAVERGQRVLFFDLCLPGGTAPILFDGSHDYNALDILRDVERCDETLVESAFQQFDNGVYLLALPEGFGWEQLPDGDFDLARLIEIFRSLFDYVVISADGGVGQSTLHTLVSESDNALLVSDQSVLRSRHNKVLLDGLRKGGARMTSVKLLIINYRAELGLAPERLADLLDLPLAATLGGRPTVRIEAMNAGETMFEHAPSDGFVRGITQLTEQILGVEAPAPRRRLGLGALFGRRGKS